LKANAANSIRIGEHVIGPGQPVFVVAELSGNHGQSFDTAVKLVHLAKEAGADAIKLQTYTADTITIPSGRRSDPQSDSRLDKDWFKIEGGTLWDGRTLHELYQESFTPWEWQPKLQIVARELGLEFFASAFDPTAVDFLEQMHVPVHKIASPELVDIPLIEKMARTGKPLILSTGMASLAEIEEAISAARKAGATQICLLKCTSSYPAAPEHANLLTLVDLATRFEVPVGLSDHTLGCETAIAAVALGACMVEKHFTASRSTPGPDSAFSLEPDEFRDMVRAIRNAERSLGSIHYGASPSELAMLKFRRSLFVVADVKAGETFTEKNVRSIRPAHGLHPRHLPEVLGRKAAREVCSGTPLKWEMVVDAPASAREIA
jgi:pseudaminic acid synthase